MTEPICIARHPLGSSSGNHECRIVTELVELPVLQHQRLEMAPNAENLLEDGGYRLPLVFMPVNAMNGYDLSSISIELYRGLCFLISCLSRINASTDSV